MSLTAQRFIILFGLLLPGAVVALPHLAAEAAKPAPLALLVGVTNYEGTGLRSLNYATRDIDELDVVLKKSGFQTVVLKNAKATKAGIEEKLKELVAGREKGQMLVIALSGHGLQSIGTDGKEDAYFCPSDTDKALEKNFLSLSGLVHQMGSRGTNLMLVDACRNDPKKGFKNFEGNELNGKLPAQTAVLFSCAAGQFSLETNRMYGEGSDRGHGVFFYHVLEGLRGKARDEEGRVTWDDLVKYVRRHVNTRAKEWEPERARAIAKDREEALADLQFQTPHALSNLADLPVLAIENGGGDNIRTEPTRPTDDMRTELKPGQEREYEIGRGVKMKFCWIPPGKAQLGSPEAERKAVWEQLKTVYELKEEPEWLQAEAEEKRGEYTSKGFWLAKYAVTQEQWLEVMGGKNPSSFCKDGGGTTAPANTSRFPVETVSWEDCQKFLDKLNDKAVGSDVVKVFGKRGKFALPDGNEWEYACRGGKGNHQAYYFGNALNGDQANCLGNYPFGTSTKGPRVYRTTEVGSYEKDYPHPWGLCDMHGNVFQWCENIYESGHVGCGGSWRSDAYWCRSARRVWYRPGVRDCEVGCRACFRPD